MPIDTTVVGRAFPPTPPHTVTEDSVAAFATATGSSPSGVPATYPVVVTFAAMQGFLDAEQVELSRIIHGDQKFLYSRPVAVGDVLTASLTVTGLRQIGGNDIISTASEITDAAGALVCTASSTLVHRGGAA